MLRDIPGDLLMLNAFLRLVPLQDRVLVVHCILLFAEAVVFAERFFSRLVVSVTHLLWRVVHDVVLDLLRFIVHVSDPLAHLPHFHFSEDAIQTVVPDEFVEVVDRLVSLYQLVYRRSFAPGCIVM